MIATVTLSNARIYNVNEIMILTNQGFNIKLDAQGESFTGLKWFSDNDPSLDIQVKDGGMQANIIADKPGRSQILVMNSVLKIAKELIITVVETLPTEADVLEVTTETLPKE